MTKSLQSNRTPVKSQWKFNCALFLFFFLAASACHAQNRDILCRDGVGEFNVQFFTGVTVHVGAGRNKELAARVCDASLSWVDQTLVLNSAASELDIDALGVEMGMGVPVVALQVKQSKAECCMAYEIYSLKQPPVLLRRISGGEFFSAADTDLDGRVEIWTDDAGAVDGFENLKLSDLDFPPPIVLRFARNRLLEVSSEFRPYFDEKIGFERGKLNAQDLDDFKHSDGQLDPSPALSVVARSRLRSTKVKILEIVWAYLYSGREADAWRSLQEMWPASDVDRIRKALLNLRAHGIRSQVDGALTVTRPGKRVPAKIFDGTVVVSATPGISPKDAKMAPPIIPPRAILMEREPPLTAKDQELARIESTLKLVIDSAGKVRSVESIGNAENVDEQLLRSTASWKFIPAFNVDQPVASQILLGVSLRR
ncbi:MAG TPA: hypothetical protein VFE02_08190 [Candidatus Acidoferrales bacterium]|nr:hypothetical protein [Candidatus Acidoferrales bacterium]